MSRSFILTPSASRDIDGIFEYVLEHDGPVRALHVYNKLHEGFLKIGAHPGIGHWREELADESLRVWTVFSFLVIYLPETRPVQIIRVLHGARDISKAIEEEV